MRFVIVAGSQLVQDVVRQTVYHGVQILTILTWIELEWMFQMEGKSLAASCQLSGWHHLYRILMTAYLKWELVVEVAEGKGYLSHCIFVLAISQRLDHALYCSHFGVDPALLQLLQSHDKPTCEDVAPEGNHRCAACS